MKSFSYIGFPIFPGEGLSWKGSFGIMYTESNEQCIGVRWKNGSLLTIFPDCGYIGRMPVNEESRRLFELVLRLRSKV